jgi:hypothetical protein
MVEDGLVYLSGHLHDFAFLHMHDMYTLHQGKHLEIGTGTNQSCGSGFSILSESVSDPIRIQCFDDQKLKEKNSLDIFLSLF